MKKIISLLILLVAANFIFINKTDAQTDNTGSGLLRHIVVVTFKKDAAADSIKVLDNIYADLGKSSFVKDFETGVNISGRDTNELKHIYMTTFVSKEAMKSYKALPEYQSLFKISLAVAEDLNVFDYWTKK